MKKTLLCCIMLLGFSIQAQAEDYDIDIKGQHAFIHFKIQHLGFSWLLGDFKRFDGMFRYDEKHPENSKVHVSIDMSSVDSNHAERDKHLRGKDFFDVAKFPEAEFKSTSFTENPDKTALLTGKLTLHGVTRVVKINVVPIGAGLSPWGDYRRGFEGRTRIALRDFQIVKHLGPSSTHVELYFSIEGVRR